MKILYLCEEYPPGKNGGIGTMVNVLGKELVKQGHEVYVVGLYPYGYGQADYEEDNGVKVWRLRYISDIGLIKNNYSFIDKILWRILKYSGILHLDTKRSTNTLFRFVKSLIETHNIDIVEMPDWNTFLHNSITTIHIPPFPVPLVVKLHGSNSYFSKEMDTAISKRIFNAELALMTRADALSSASFYTAHQTKKIFNLSKEITVLHNSVNMSPGLRNQPFGSKVVFTGALIKKKGIRSLLKAWNIVNAKCPEATLHIFGKGPVNDLKKILNKKVLPSVVFHGHVAREILFGELATATAAIFPSYTECFSFAPLEAMAAGCAVIYSSRSSGPELITDKENGLLVDPDDIDAIADALILMLKDKSLQTKVAEAGYNTISEKFNITISAKQHVDFYNNIQANFNIGKISP